MRRPMPKTRHNSSDAGEPKSSRQKDEKSRRGTAQPQKMLKMKVECAGINRQEAEDEKSSRERSSEPLGPEFCAVGREAWSEA